LQQALQELSTTVHRINEQKRQAEQQREVESIFKNLELSKVTYIFLFEKKTGIQTTSLHFYP
jgi:hypothetical protein